MCRRRAIQTRQSPLSIVQYNLIQHHTLSTLRYTMWSLQSSTMRSCVLIYLSTLAYAKNCTNHPAYDGIIVEGPVQLIDDPLKNFDATMIPLYNGSAIEDWSHDAASADGSTGLAFTSSRGSISGVPGAQRLFISVAWPNGTRYMENVFTEKSNIEMCPRQDDRSLVQRDHRSGLDVRIQLRLS